MTDKDQCRATFHKWYEEKFYAVRKLDLHDDGTYHIPAMQERWDAWQAAWTRQSADLAALREENARLSGALAEIIHEAATYEHTNSVHDQAFHLAVQDALDTYADIARAALSIPAAERESVPEGCKLVPVEPTLDMYYAACKAYCAWEVQCAEEERAGNEFSQPNFTHSDVYRAMIAAAPKEPAAKRESVPETDFRR